MASFRKHGKVWYYRFVNADGKKLERKGCTDRRATEDMARAAESEAAKIRSGLINPKELAYRDHQARPLKEHISAWESNLLAQGFTPKHAEHTSNRVRRLVAVMLGSADALKDHRRLAPNERGDVARRISDAIAPARLSDLTGQRVQDAIARLRDAKWSLQTCNHYRASVKAFSKWCHDDHRMQDDPLRGVKGYNAKEDRRHDRRTISLDELRRLIDASQRGPTVMGMTGPARAICYRLAVATGLRFAELASIKPESFDWDAPSVTVSAAYTKNGDPATLPLQGDMADDLASFVASLPAGEPIFSLPEEKGAKMLRVDLKAAGIPYQDASGLFFDFHSLRCEMATLADAAGVTPRVVQKLMRHSTLELTGRYTRPRVVDIEAAASMLPSLKPEGDNPEVLAATGTDGRVSHRFIPDGTDGPLKNPGNEGGKGPSISKDLSHYFPTAQAGTMRDLSEAGVISGLNVPTLMKGSTPENKVFDASSRLKTGSVGERRRPDSNRGWRFCRPLPYHLATAPKTEVKLPSCDSSPRRNGGSTTLTSKTVRGKLS